MIPRPSLVNLQEKELKPTDQDTVYVCSAPVKGHVHKEFSHAGMQGRGHGQQRDARTGWSSPCRRSAGVEIDMQPYFCLNRLKQDLLLNEDGSFYEKRPPIPNQDYGAAISLTFTLKPQGDREAARSPIVLDFPQQRLHRRQGHSSASTSRASRTRTTRAVDMAKIALDNYPAVAERTTWRSRSRIFDLIQTEPLLQGRQGRRLAADAADPERIQFPACRTPRSGSRTRTATTGPGSWNASTTPTSIPRTWTGIRWCC